MSKYEINSNDIRAKVDAEINRLYKNMSQEQKKGIIKNAFEGFKYEWKKLIYSPEQIKYREYNFDSSFTYDEINRLIDIFTSDIYDICDGKDLNINIAEEYKKALSQNTIFHERDIDDFMDVLFNNTLKTAIKGDIHKVDTLMYFKHAFEKKTNKRQAYNADSMERFNDSLKRVISAMKKKDGLAENLISGIFEDILENNLKPDFVNEMYDININYGFDVNDIVESINGILNSLELIKRNSVEIEQYLKDDAKTIRMEAFNTKVTPKTLLKRIESNEIFSEFNENDDVLEQDIFGLDSTGYIIFKDRDEGSVFNDLVRYAEQAEEEKMQEEDRGR